MSDLMNHESIDDRARRAVQQLRSNTSVRSLPELRLRERRRWLAPIVAAAVVVAVVIGLVVIGTNRNDRTLGNDPARFQWIVTELPAGWSAQKAFDPFAPGDRKPPAPIDNVYATVTAPEGPVLEVTGSNGSADAEIVPGEGTSFNETNYRELTIDGRRAALADSNGQRIMYIETGGHWMKLTSRHIDDESLARLAESAIRNVDGTALIPPTKLTNGLKLLAPAGVPRDPTWLARLDGELSVYGVVADGSRILGLSVSRPVASVRAGVALLSDNHSVSIGTAIGYAGSFNLDPPTVVAQTLYWERDGLAFYLYGQGLTETEMLAAAISIRPATPDEWTALVNAPATNEVSQGTIPTGTTPANTVAPPTPAIHDVPIEVSVTVVSPNEQTWSGVLPTGERWSLDLARVYNTISFLGEVDGQSAGISGDSFDTRDGTTSIQGFDGGYVVTADKRGSAMRILRSNGDRYTIALRDLPGTNGLRVAVLALPDTSPEQRIELIDATGNVIESYADGVRRDATGNEIQPTP
jgi:hypothetical protein